MRQVWLRTNRRAMAFGMILPAVVAGVGALLAAGSAHVWLRAAGLLMAALAGLAFGSLAILMAQPRLAFGDGKLQIYAGLRAHRVPVELVECFFLGHGSGLLPGRKGSVQTKTLVIRLARSATQWSQRAIKPAIGKWCDGYITIRGTWCEPLDIDLVKRLNRRLSEVNARQGGRKVAT